MTRLIKRGSKTSLFFIFSFIFIILSGVIVAITESIKYFSLVLFGLGSLFLTLSTSEVEKKRSEVLLFGFGVLTSAACFWTSYFNYYVAGKIITAELFALLGIFLLAPASYIFFKQRRTSP